MQLHASGGVYTTSRRFHGGPFGGAFSTLAFLLSLSPLEMPHPQPTRANHYSQALDSWVLGSVQNL